MSDAKSPRHPGMPGERRVLACESSRRVFNFTSDVASAVAHCCITGR